MYSSCPQDISTLSSPQPLVDAARGLILGHLAVGVGGEELGKHDLSREAQPTGNVSPTTAHCGSPNRHRILPKSWISPVRMNQRGCPSRRMASAVCSRCSICGKLGVGVAVVDQRVEKLQRLPKAHLVAVERQVFGPLCRARSRRSDAVVEPVELLDLGAGLGGVVAESGRVDGLARCRLRRTRRLRVAPSEGRFPTRSRLAKGPGQCAGFVMIYGGLRFGKLVG